MSQKSAEMIKEYQNKHSRRMYQLALSSAAGIEPQKYEVYKSRLEAQELCDKYNKQYSNPYAKWIVLER